MNLNQKKMVTMDTIIRTYIIFVSDICYCLNLFKSNLLGGPTIANNSSNDPCNFMDLNYYKKNVTFEGSILYIIRVRVIIQSILK